MSQIQLWLPPGAVQVGEILGDYSSAPHRLSPDILQVCLPTGVTIDVGWTPTFDPRGTFQITVFRGDWGDDVLNRIIVASPYDVARLVGELAAEHSGAVVASPRGVSNSAVAEVEVQLSPGGRMFAGAA